MALPDVLSAMRSIILDPLEIPKTQSERLAYYGKIFPKLGAYELEDLAKIDPERFSVYTHSIFSAERGILRTHFPLTFKLMAAAWPAAYAEELNTLKFVKDLHTKRPWKNSATLGLGRNLRDSLKYDRPELLAKAPYLAELAELELLTLTNRRYPDEDFEAFGALRQSEIAGLTVQELLSMGIVVPSNVQMLKTDFDVLESYLTYESSGREVVPSAGESYALVARDERLHPSWQRISKPLYECLSSLERMRRCEIGVLAEACVEGVEASDEAELFRKFLERLGALREAGAVKLCR